MLPLLCVAFLLAMLAADLSPALEVLAVVGLVFAACAGCAAMVDGFFRWLFR